MCLSDLAQARCKNYSRMKTTPKIRKGKLALQDLFVGAVIQYKTDEGWHFNEVDALDIEQGERMFRTHMSEDYKAVSLTRETMKRIGFCEQSYGNWYHPELKVYVKRKPTGEVLHGNFKCKYLHQLQNYCRLVLKQSLFVRGLQIKIPN